MVVAAFVAPFLLPATARFVATAAKLPDVSLAVITAEPVERLPTELKHHLDGHWRVDDTLDPRQLVEAVRGLSQQLGPVERLVGALEQLQVPMAYVREQLGIDGMDTQTALNVRDKSRMKTVLRAAGIPCARHQLVTNASEAFAFAEAVGFPLVAKPPAGAGAQATYRLDDVSALRGWLEALPPHSDAPGLLEEFLTGEEHTFDSVTVGGQTVFSSIADYLPTPLEVLRQPWIQWTVVLPRELDDPRYDGIWEIGPAALQALGVRDALTHMEWFAGRTVQLLFPRWRHGRRVRRSRRCWDMCTTWTSTGSGRSWSSSAGSTRPNAATPPGLRTCVVRAAAGFAPFMGSTSCSARSGSSSSKRACRMWGNPPRQVMKGRGTSSCGILRPRSSGMPCTASSAGSGWSWSRRSEHCDDLARLPGGDGVFHSSALGRRCDGYWNR